MVLDPATAIALLPRVLDLALKIAAIIQSGSAKDLTGEIAALEKARLLPSADVIAQADADTQRTGE